MALPKSIWGPRLSFKQLVVFTKKNGFVEVAKEALPATFPLMAVDTKKRGFPKAGG